MSFDRVYGLFRDARALESRAERRAFLDAHVDDAAIRERVEDLLSHHDEAEGSTEAPADSPLRAALETSFTAAEESLPEQIGPYRVIGLLGRGGMATVYRARQEVPARDIALKVLHVGGAAALDRFRREAEVLARLEHPGIAPIFDVGEAAGRGGPRAYLAMQLIDGRPLNAVEGTLDVGRIVDLLLQILDATAHAHQRGIVHRDLKPSNILVDGDGRCRLLDFGIARVLDDDTGHTATGDVLGTLRYMSPEQASGDGRQVDTRTDVYAIGLMAYELLAGRHPLGDVTGGPAAVLQTVLTREPASLRGVAPHVPSDLATVVHKALEREPDRRYSSASAFADDLRRFLAARPVEARDPTVGYQVRKFVGRHRALVLGATTAFAALVVALVLTLAALRQAKQQRARADRHAEAVASGTAHLRLQAADVALSAHRVASAREHLAAIPADRRGWVWHHLQAATDTTIASLPRDPVRTTVRVTDDGRLEAVAGPAPAPGDRNLYVLAEGAERAPHVLPAARGWHALPWTRGAEIQLRHERVLLREAPRAPPKPLKSVRVSCMAIDPVGRRVLLGTHDRRVVAWDPETGATTDLGVETVADVTAVAFDAEHGRLAASSARGVVQVFQLPGGSTLATLHAGDRDTQRLGFLPGARRLVGLSRDDVYLWDMDTLASMHTLVLPTGDAPVFVYGVDVSADGERAAAVTWTGELHLVDLRRMRLLASHALPLKRLFAVRFLPGDGGVIVQGSGRMLRVDPSTGRTLAEVRGGGGGEDLALSSAAGVAAVLRLRVNLCDVYTLGLEDDTGGVVSLPRAPCEVAHPRQLQRWSPLAFDARGGRLLRRAIDGWALHRWPDGQLLASGATREEYGPILRLRFLREGGFVAATSRGAVTVRELPSGRERLRLAAHEGAVYALAVHPSQPLLATGGADGTVRLWSLDTGQPLLLLRAHAEYVKDLAFTPDGAALLSTGGDGRVRAWSTRPLAERRAQARAADPGHR